MQKLEFKIKRVSLFVNIGLVFFAVFIGQCFADGNSISAGVIAVIIILFIFLMFRLYMSTIKNFSIGEKEQFHCNKIVFTPIGITFKHDNKIIFQASLSDIESSNLKLKFVFAPYYGILGLYSYYMNRKNISSHVFTIKLQNKSKISLLLEGEENIFFRLMDLKKFLKLNIDISSNDDSHYSVKALRNYLKNGDTRTLLSYKSVWIQFSIWTIFIISFLALGYFEHTRPLFVLIASFVRPFRENDYSQSSIYYGGLMFITIAFIAIICVHFFTIRDKIKNSIWQKKIQNFIKSVDDYRKLCALH